MTNNKPIQLTEQDLHMLVEDAVKQYLTENGMEEGALWNAFKQKGQQIGQGIMNVGRNMANTYQTGRQNKKLQQYATNLISYVDNFIKMAGQFPDLSNLVAASQNYVTQIQRTMAASQNNLNNVASQTFSTNRPNMQ